MKKITQKIRRPINKEIQDLLSPIYFNEIPLGDLFDILEAHGLVAVQEDNTRWSGILCGESVHTTFDLADMSESRSENGLTFYDEPANGVLVLSWYKMASGRYEIVAYLS
jgi:hypothetical protein